MIARCHPVFAHTGLPIRPDPNALLALAVLAKFLIVLWVLL